jgi:hypothetical protein
MAISEAAPERSGDVFLQLAEKLVVRRQRDVWQ